MRNTIAFRSQSVGSTEKPSIITITGIVIAVSIAIGIQLLMPPGVRRSLVCINAGGQRDEGSTYGRAWANDDVGRFVIIIDQIDDPGAAGMCRRWSVVLDRTAVVAHIHVTGC